MNEVKEIDYFTKFKICQVCGRNIKRQKVMLCSECKIAVRVEYEALKKQTAKKVYKVLNACG